MTFITHPDRRDAERFHKALKVRFSVNGGPEQVSDTINFTARSVAIRSDWPVRKHDKIVAYVDDLPELTGSVIRVFDEGFAMCLNDSSLALVANAGAEIPSLRAKPPAENAEDDNNRRILSPVFRADAPAPAWGQITTARNGRGGNEKHFLSIVTTGAMDLNDIHNVWVAIEHGRWTAQIIQTKRQDNQAMIVVLLNEWQLRLAAKHGLEMTVLSTRFSEWTARLHRDPIAAHLASFAPIVAPEAAAKALADAATALRA